MQHSVGDGSTVDELTLNQQIEATQQAAQRLNEAINHGRIGGVFEGLSYALGVLVYILPPVEQASFEVFNQLVADTFTRATATIAEYGLEEDDVVNFFNFNLDHCPQLGPTEGAILDRITQELSALPADHNPFQTSYTQEHMASVMIPPQQLEIIMEAVRDETANIDADPVAILTSLISRYYLGGEIIDSDMDLGAELVGSDVEQDHPPAAPPPAARFDPGVPSFGDVDQRAIIGAAETQPLVNIDNTGNIQASENDGYSSDDVQNDENIEDPVLAAAQTLMEMRSRE